MTEKKDRDRVMAEITLSHLLRLATEQGSPLSLEQALAFLNQEGRAFEMWKQMMHAGEEFIAGSLLKSKGQDFCQSSIDILIEERASPTSLNQASYLTVIVIKRILNATTLIGKIVKRPSRFRTLASRP